MTPYYEDDHVTLYQGDALKLLDEMEDGSVDAVVCDPPYSSGGLHRSDRVGSAKAKYLSSGHAAVKRLPEFYGDSRSERGLMVWSALWLAECWRVTKDGGAIAVFCDWRSLPTFSDALQVGGWSWRGVGVWSKPRGASRPTRGGLWNDSEFILWGSRGARTDEIYLPGTWTIAAPKSAQRRHATEKPLPVVRDLVKLAPLEQVVLDPFAGSGTTGIAAREEGRRAILMELSKEGAEVAADRLRVHASTGADLSTVGGNQDGLDFGSAS